MTRTPLPPFLPPPCLDRSRLTLSSDVSTAPSCHGLLVLSLLLLLPLPLLPPLLDEDDAWASQEDEAVLYCPPRGSSTSLLQGGSKAVRREEGEGQ